jgi:hypothetical protein
MNIALLTDFTPQQIDLLLETIEEKLIKLETAKMKAELNEADAPWIIKILDEDLDTFMLWKIQLKNAREVVSKQQEVNSN